MSFETNIFNKIILAFLLIIVALNSACKKTGKQAVDSVSPLYPYYSTENDLISVSKEIDSGFSGDSLFVQTYYEPESFWEAYRECCIPKVGDDEEKEYPFLPIDSQGNVMTPENLLLVLDDCGEIKETYDLNQVCGTSLTSRKMLCDKDGCWVMSLQLDAFSGEQLFQLDHILENGEIKEQITLEIDPAQISVLDFDVCEDGRIALTCWSDRSQMILFDPFGSFLESIDLPENASSNVVSYNGQWTCIGSGKEDGAVLFQYDKTNHWKETPVSAPVERKIVVRDNNLFGISTREIVWIDETSSTMLSWEDVSVWGTIRDVKFLENGNLDLLARPLSEDLLVRYHLSPSENQTQMHKEEFVIAGYDLENSCVNQLVQEMSLRHPEVKFVMRDYKDEINATEENWPQAKKEIAKIISLDLASGNAPDMYFDLYDDLGMEDLGRLGYLKDLTPVISELNEDEYFIDKITLGQEIPYCACLYFDIIGFCASEDYVENPYIWTYEDFYRSSLKFSGLDFVQSIFSKQYLLKHAVMAQIDKFVQDGKANFTGDDFLRVMKWANDIGCRSNWDEYVPAELDNGIFMLDWADIVSLGSVIMYQDYVIVGFPNEGGSLHVVPYSVLAVSATSSQMELANEIVKYALGESFQSENYQLQGGISVNRKYCEKRMEEDYELFVKVDSRELRYSKEEYYDRYLKIIERGDRYLHGNQAIIDICLEEAEAYFAGDSTAERVAELIQNRVTVYLQETSS